MLARTLMLIRQHTLTAALTWVGPALALVIASPAWSQPQPTDEQVKFAANAEMVKGHLLSSRELYAMRQEALAAIHAAHPVQELWNLLRGPLNRATPDLATRVGVLLEKPGRKVDARVPTEQYRATVDAVFAAMDEAVSKVVPAPVRSSLAFRARVILELIQRVEEEYAEGVKGGKVVEAVEYQDAYGFFHRAQALYRPIASQVRARAPKAAKEIDGALATLAKGFARVTPPPTSLAVEKVQEQTREIVTELGKATGVQVAARGGAVEEIGSVRTGIQQALDAYKGGQVARAEELVTAAYLDHFEKAEGPLEQRDMALMKKLEQLIRVELRGKIKGKAPVGEVEQLVRTILASLDQAEKLLEGR